MLKTPPPPNSHKRSPVSISNTRPHVSASEGFPSKPNSSSDTSMTTGIISSMVQGVSLGTGHAIGHEIGKMMMGSGKPNTSPIPVNHDPARSPENTPKCENHFNMYHVCLQLDSHESPDCEQMFTNYIQCLRDTMKV